MLRKTPVFFVLLALTCPAVSHADPSAPTNYDECILDAMRGVSSDVAARAIIESCRSLFPESPGDAAPQAAPSPAPQAASAPQAAPPPTAVEAAPLDTADARSLTADELDRLRARARVFGARYRVIVDNDNPDLTLTEVTIAVWDDNDPVASRKEYTGATQIAPQSSATVQYTVHYRGDETGWNWDVVAARGVE